jgi:hypothetical protein
MSARLASGTLVSALVRRVDQEGGSAMVLARGDATAGGILILTLERGANPRFYERGIGPDGLPALVESGPKQLDEPGAVTDYWRKRRSFDSDLWVVELDVAGAERFAAAVLAIG